MSSAKHLRATPIKEIFPEVFPKASWTVILFLNAESDLLEDMKTAYNQLASVGSNVGLVNFVALFDGIAIDREGIKINKAAIKKGSKDLLDSGVPKLYFIRRYRNFFDEESIRSYPEHEDLTNPENLHFVLSDIKQKFPADQYAFIYKGHGGQNPNINNAVHKTDITTRLINDQGEIENDEALTARMNIKHKPNGWSVHALATLSSESSAEVEGAVLVILVKEGYNELSYFQLNQVLQQVFHGDERLAFISLECCWGQLLENGYAFRGTTDFLIASADEAPMFCIDYEQLCTFLLKNPEIKPHELASAIVAVYYTTSYKDYLSDPRYHKMGISLTCVNMRILDRVVEKLTDVCYHLIKNMDKHWKNVAEARSRCKEYTYELDPEEYGMYNIDLIWFLENLHYYNNKQEEIDYWLNNKITALIQDLSLYYIKSYLGNNYKETTPGEEELGGKGVAISFPARKCEFDNSLYGNNNNDFAQWLWKDFLQVYYQHLPDQKIIDASKWKTQKIYNRLAEISG